MSSEKARPPRLRTATSGALFLLTLLVAVVAFAAQLEPATHAAGSERFRNAYTVAGESGEWLGGSYVLRRAWVQITRDLSNTEVPPTLPLDLQAMAQRPFAVNSGSGMPRCCCAWVRSGCWSIRCSQAPPGRCRASGRRG
jgi:hypothetical protein